MYHWRYCFRVFFPLLFVSFFITRPGRDSIGTIFTFMCLRKYIASLSFSLNLIDPICKIVFLKISFLEIHIRKWRAVRANVSVFFYF